MTWLVEELEAAGYRLTLAGEKIRLDFEGEGEPDGERAARLIGHLHQHKAEVLTHLQQQSAGTLEPRIRFARSEGELDALVEEIQAGFEAGRLSQAQAERLGWLVIDTARQLARGLVNVPVGAL